MLHAKEEQIMLMWPPTVFCVCPLKFRLEDLVILMVTNYGNSKNEP